MRSPFVFKVRSISIEEGFTLEGEGVVQRPVKCRRLFEAVVLAAQISRDLEAEIQIFDTEGIVVETLPIHPVSRKRLEEIAA